MAFALAYWEIVAMIGLGLAGGTVSLVSQNYGGESERASLVVGQSVLLVFVLATPMMAAFVVLAGPMIGLFDPSSEPLAHGRTYLVFVAPAIGFEMLNLIASRTYTAVGDTFTEMVARASGAVLNIVLSAVLIFGFEMGVAGAAIGTTVSTGVVTVVLGWGMVGRSYGSLGMEPSPVPITRAAVGFEPAIVRQIVEISAPEIGRRLAQGIIVFPLLWIAATFGPVIVTAIEVGRRIRSLLNSVNWGLGLASSSLVGQRLGAGEDEAGAYGRAIIRLSIVIYVGLALLVVAFAEPIASLFVETPAEAAQAGTFVAVGAISAIGLGIDGAAAGSPRRGRHRLPFVASLIGRYLFALPVAALGLVTPLGIVALYLALLLETYVPGGINYWLFRRGRWK